MTENYTDPRMKIFASVFAIVMIGAGFLLFSDDAENSDGAGGIPKLSIAEEDYEFGDISMANGLASHEFTIKNDGEAPLILTNLSTSCACTRVVLVNNGKRSPEFGMQEHGTNPLIWSDRIEPGASAIIEATFDPLAHGPDATGYITRTINVYSNTGGKEDTKSIITFSGNVIK